MTNQKEIGSGIIALLITNQVEIEEASAMFSVLNGAPLLREIPSQEQQSVGIGIFSNVKDSDGNLLVAGKNYMLRSKKVKVLREEFGSGNFMDTYYKVYFLDETLEERHIVVDGKYTNGLLAGATYPSNFEPVHKEN